MNRSFQSRLQQASQYQKQAIRALLPDHVNAHLDVIENEICTLIKDVLIDGLQNEFKSQSATTPSEPQPKDDSKIRKVKIL